ncbi:hypothetical protein EON65_42540 [archaeon]|nr:MAG: hypothetical protein EON65_42540 [archaeon]
MCELQSIYKISCQPSSLTSSTYDGCDAALFDSLIEEDSCSRTGSSGLDSSDIHLSEQRIKQYKLSINEEEIKKNIRKRRAELSIEERKKEDKDAEKRYQFTFTRLFSHDIRRYIAQMHSNMINSPDASTNIWNFFHDFAVPNVQCKNLLAPAIYSMPLSQYAGIILKKREDVINLWTSYIGSHPDGVGTLLGTQVIRKYNSKTSEVRMRSNYRGTYEKVVDIPSVPPSTNSTDPTFPTVRVVKLIPINVMMCIVFHMNADNIITHIDIDGRFFLTPL